MLYSTATRGSATQRGARLNLRKGDFAFQGDMDYLKAKVGRLSAFAAILLVLAVGSVWARFRALSMREHQVDQQRRRLGEPCDDLGGLLDRRGVALAFEQE